MKAKDTDFRTDVSNSTEFGFWEPEVEELSPGQDPSGAPLISVTAWVKSYAFFVGKRDPNVFWGPQDAFLERQAIDRPPQSPALFYSQVLTGEGSRPEVRLCDPCTMAFVPLASSKIQVSSQQWWEAGGAAG